MQPIRKITSFDLKILTEELNKKLAGSRIQKVFSFNPSGKKEDTEIHFLIHIPMHGTHRLIIGTDKIFLTKKPIIHDNVSSNFALYLRKHLKSKRIVSVKQHNFDRVLIIEFENNFLVCEIFGKSNLLFLDKENEILALKTRKIWSGRALKRNEKYIYPPLSENIFSVNKELFEKLLQKSDKKIVSYLSSELSLGKEYANAVCTMAKIDKSIVCSDLKEKQTNSLFVKIQKLIKAEKKPFFVENTENKIIDYSPVQIPTEEQKQCTPTFIDAVEKYYLGNYIIHEEKKENATENRSADRFERIEQNQMKNKKKIEENIIKINKKIEVIKENYESITTILLDLNSALLKFKITEVKEKIIASKKRNNETTKHIEDIDEKTKEVLFKIKDIKFKFCLNKTIEQNIALVYDELKKTKGKLMRLDIAQKQQEKEKPIKSISKTKLTLVEKQWYHKFHWFFTSNNILAIGGKTAQQNEEVIKKYAKEKDIVFHCDIAGSPFVVLKTSQVKTAPTKEDLHETAVFSAVHSKAWRIGIGAIESYWVNREQVTKKAPSGEYIGTGSFMIYGKKNILKTVLEYAVGFADGKLIFGPVGAIEKSTKKYIVVIPGDILKSKLVKQIKDVLAEKLNKEEKEILRQVNVNYIENFLPGLKGQIKK
ncbi:MAG: NFACT family protein [Candidatus Aenigmarchaeota archaeon]|nr:NFACT family protein [Candidatus Aenigmarchaeota archaeon]